MNVDRNKNAAPVAIWLAALGAVACALLVSLRSAENLAPTWDEGDAFYRAERVQEWLIALARGSSRERDWASLAPEGSQRRELRKYFASLESRRELFSSSALEIGFQHAIYREGHPAGCSFAIALGSLAARALGIDAFFSEKTALRFGGIFLFSLALGGVFLRTSFSFGALAGAAAVVGVVSCPHAFGHSLIAGSDSLLISSWLLAWALFPSARRSFGAAVLWGIALGVSFSAKFSGLLAAAPFLLIAFWELVSRGIARGELSRLAARLALGFAVGVAVFALVDPPLWRAPIQGLKTFWTLNTRRVGFNIPAYFFGEFYSLDRPEPPWNGFFWIAATTPVFLLISALAFLASQLKGWRRRGAGALNDRDDRSRLVATALLLGMTLPFVRAFPGAPPHDGVRLIVASAAFWGLLGGLGAAWIARRLFPEKRAFRFAVVALLLTPGLLDVTRRAPLYLSFYGAAVGGVVGADKLGLETTYYWDSLDADVVSRLRDFSERARVSGAPDGILFSAFSSQTLDFYRRWNTFGAAPLATISSPAAFQDLSRFGFYALQARPSAMTRFDAWVVKNAPLLFTKQIADPLPNPFSKPGAKVVVLEVYDLGGTTELK